MLSSLSELTLIILDMELIHLGSEVYSRFIDKIIIAIFYKELFFLSFHETLSTNKLKCKK